MNLFTDVNEDEEKERDIERKKERERERENKLESKWNKCECYEASQKKEALKKISEDKECWRLQSMICLPLQSKNSEWVSN